MVVWKQLTRAHLDQTKQQFASGGYVAQWYAMAMEVILTTLGPDWWKKNCLLSSAEPDPFLRTDDKTEAGRYEHQDRAIRLGHMLYALKDCVGFETFVEKLKSRNVESVFFELLAASSLQKSGLAVSFVQETGVKGEDYDLLATKDGFTVHVEAKSRRGELILSESTLENALRVARRQLPAIGPGIIFVWIPVEWTQNPDVESAVGRVIESFFRNTKRVNSVVVLWESWMVVSMGKAKAVLVRQYDNPNARVTVHLGKVVKPIDTNSRLTPDSFVPSFW
jgi:hypothetical protein